MSQHRLVCPFLDESPTFARGVEIGLLFAKMRRVKKIDDLFLRANQDQILLLASRLEWTVVKMKAKGDWIRIRMKKSPRQQSAGG